MSGIPKQKGGVKIKEHAAVVGGKSLMKGIVPARENSRNQGRRDQRIVYKFGAAGIRIRFWEVSIPLEQYIHQTMGGGYTSHT